VEIEDGSTNFADIDAGPADLARLLVTEFAVAFSNDWFVVPARVPVGSATDVLRKTVVDNFRGQFDVQSAAARDDGPTSIRSWRVFELAGDELNEAPVAPLSYADQAWKYRERRSPLATRPDAAVGGIGGGATRAVTTGSAMSGCSWRRPRAAASARAVCAGMSSRSPPPRPDPRCFHQAARLAAATPRVGHN